MFKEAATMAILPHNLLRVIEHLKKIQWDVCMNRKSRRASQALTKRKQSFSPLIVLDPKCVMTQTIMSLMGEGAAQMGRESPTQTRGDGSHDWNKP